MNKSAMKVLSDGSISTPLRVRSLNEASLETSPGSRGCADCHGCLYDDGARRIRKRKIVPVEGIRLYLGIAICSAETFDITIGTLDAMIGA